MQNTFPFQHVLITGGAGFIGSWIIRELLAQAPHTHITNLDALTYAGNLDNIADISGQPERYPHYRFLQGDIRSPEDMAAVFASASVPIDAVIHCAAQTHVDRSVLGPRVFVDTNVMGTFTVMEAARLQATPPRVLVVSTDEVYGSLGDTGAFTETSPLEPNSPYSSSKAGADLLALSYVSTYGMDVRVTRCSNNYGPYQYPEKLIPLCILKALHKEPLPIYGDGLYVRDWIHVADHARAVLTVLQDAPKGAVVNIGARNEQTNLAIAERLLLLTGQPADAWHTVADRPGHDRRYAIDPQRIEQLGWQPQIPFEQGLAETVAWYQQNPDWIARVEARKQAMDETTSFHGQFASVNSK